MDTFLKNYWSMYLDFLHDFETLTYRNFEIVYFCHLPSYVLPNTDLMNELHKDSFLHHFKRVVSSSEDIQNKFSSFTAKHTKNHTKTTGKIAIHIDKLLRFPQHSLQQYFSSSNTVLLTNGIKQKSKRGLVKKKNRARPINQTVAVVKRKKRSKLPKIQNIPIQYFEDFKVNIDTKIKQVQQQARELFIQYQDHWLYSRASFQKWLLQNISSVMTYMEITEQLLKNIAISCFVISTSHSYISRILAVIGSSKGIPSICMQHGIISSELGYIPKIATVDALYGQFEKDWYTRLGIKEEALEIIGHPRFDQIDSPPSVGRASFYQSLGLIKGRKTIMIAVRSNEDINQWRTFIQTLNNKKKFNILIKNYPSKQPHPLTKEFSNVFPTRNYQIYDLFPHVDAVVAYSSTVGLEAMLSNKPVFILTKDFPGATGYYRGIGELMQYDPQQLAEKMVAYFTQSDYQQYAHKKWKQFLRYAYPSNQKSMDRLHVLIHRIVREGYRDG